MTHIKQTILPYIGVYLPIRYTTYYKTIKILIKTFQNIFQRENSSQNFGYFVKNEKSFDIIIR